MSIEDKVQWVYDSQNNQELKERYDVWAQDYEQDLDDQFGYIGPEPGVDVGLAAVGGLGIVLLAIMLDRLTQAIANPH